MIRIKRIYDSPSKEDGKRILVDRLWPRGIRKDKALIDEWLKDIAPSNELRKWFSHDPSRWDEFKKRYGKELLNKSALLGRIKKEYRIKNVTLLFSARDTRYNNASALKEILEHDDTRSSIERRL
jgi:uncharacterized protein YeaO (DUF488 family)